MNTFTSVCNLCRKPEELELGDKPCIKLRLADNVFGDRNDTLFFDAIFSGPDVKVVSELDSGDQVVVSGTLTLGSYKATKGRLKGKTVTTHSVPFCKLLRVTKSKFLTKNEQEEQTTTSKGDAGDDTDPLAAGNGAAETGGEDPLADLA